VDRVFLSSLRRVPINYCISPPFPGRNGAWGRRRAATPPAASSTSSAFGPFGFGFPGTAPLLSTAEHHQYQLPATSYCEKVSKIKKKEKLHKNCEEQRKKVILGGGLEIGNWKLESSRETQQAARSKNIKCPILEPYPYITIIYP
jgi:hypothetical protein